MYAKLQTISNGKEKETSMVQLPDYFQQLKPLCSADLILLGEAAQSHQF